MQMARLGKVVISRVNRRNSAADVLDNATALVPGVIAAFRSPGETVYGARLQHCYATF